MPTHVGVGRRVGVGFHMRLHRLVACVNERCVARRIDRRVVRLADRVAIELGVLAWVLGSGVEMTDPVWDVAPTLAAVEPVVSMT